MEGSIGVTHQLSPGSISGSDAYTALHQGSSDICYQWWAMESGEAEVASVDEEKNDTTTFQLAPSLWCRGWCPSLQGIARLCCNARKKFRTTPITYLQRSLSVHDFQSLLACELPVAGQAAGASTFIGHEVNDPSPTPISISATINWKIIKGAITRLIFSRILFLDLVVKEILRFFVS